MIRKCAYNEKTDLQAVLEGLEVDLTNAIENGVIDNTGEDAIYNDIEDPSVITGRVEDIFQAIDKQKGIVKQAAASATTSNEE